MNGLWAKLLTNTEADIKLPILTQIFLIQVVCCTLQR